MKSLEPEPHASRVGRGGVVWTVGAGVLTMAFFPFALPSILLIAIVALPLLLIALAAGLLTVPALLLRRLWRAARRSRRTSPTAA